MRVALVYPHQLYPSNPAVDSADKVYLIEDPLFFQQYSFHRKKLILHRASMKAYADSTLSSKDVRYIEAAKIEKSGDVLKLIAKLKPSSVACLEVNDDWLTHRLNYEAQRLKLSIDWLDDPYFLTSDDQIQRFAKGKTSLFFTNFYIEQRKRLKILLDEDGSPVGGKWSFDTENRKKLPKSVVPPPCPWNKPNDYVAEATKYVDKCFPNAVGESSEFGYPIDRKSALKWLKDFMAHRFVMFGDYEDAISTQEQTLFHSLLTPSLNIGLITPKDILDEANKHIDRVPLNSYEGFIRQIIGWREYMRAVYRLNGRQQRTRNFWKFTRSLPQSFYDGSTGIVPFDETIKRALKTGYCHHIERLMVLGNFMLLCRIDPDDVYRWFMELFIDAYDWVMVPNVYAMSQYADGGKITTKPYISGSAYIRRMSDYPSGDWCEVWDALYWTFIDDHQQFFASNPRMKVMTSQLTKMGSKLDKHRTFAEQFLRQLK